MKKSVVFCILVLSALIFILMTSNASAYGVDELKKLLEGSKQKNDLFYDWINSNFNFEYPSEQRIGEIADAENNCVGSCSDGFICYYKHGRCGEVPESYLDIPSNWCNPKTCTLAEQSYYFSSFPPAKADIKSLCQIAEEKIRPNYCKTFQTYETGNAVYCIEKPRTSGRCITYYLATNSKVAGHCTDFGCVPDINEADSDGDGLLAYSATTYKFEPSGIVYTDNKENKYSLKEGMPTNPRTVRWGDCMDNDDRNVRGLNLDDAIASRVDFSLSYVDDTKKTRKFTPSGLVSPFDDIALIFTFPSPANCSFPFNGFGNPIVELSVDGKVLYNYTNLETEEVVDLEHNQIMESLIIRGWSNGQMGIIPDTNKMEQLVDAIVNNKDIVFTVKNATGWAAGWKYVWNSETNTRETQGDEIPQRTQQVTTKMTNCVHIGGSGAQKVVTMRAKSAQVLARAIMRTSSSVIEGGFDSVDPFKTYIASFSFYADLVNHDDTDWSMLFSKNLIYSSWNKPKQISSCGKDGSQYYFINGRTWPGGGIAVWGSKVAYVSRNHVYWELTMHEMGHSYCSLEDEYTGIFIQKITFPTVKNCAVLPRESYYYRGNLYGDTFWKGCTRGSIYRPSDNGLMNSGSAHSVVDCGYCLRSIKGGSSVKGYWPECMILDTIKPNCSVGGCPGKMFCSTKDQQNCPYPNAFKCNAATGLCKYS